MDISIITASYNMLPYLKRARRSIADQSGPKIEHIVADGESTDGTVEWLKANAQSIKEGANGSAFRYFSKKDDGMYDALNNGFDHAKGEVVAWLNCDEQYLPGTLARVHEIFRSDPELDILFGGALLVDPEGGLLSLRRSYPARALYISTSHLYNLSCAMFFRRRIWQGGLRFDTSFRNLGDHDLILRALRSGCKTKAVGDIFSVFSFTGNNLSWSEEAKQEAELLREQTPGWVKLLRLPINGFRLLEKWLHGGYSQRPFKYEIYTNDESGERVSFDVENTSVRWPEDK